MIKGLHAIFFTPQVEEMRAFIRDKLGFRFSDAGDGWLIFEMPAADIACHPANENFQEMSFYCDDIHPTVVELRERGVEFTSEIKEMEWGLSTTFRMPGGVEVQLYQPFYGK
jgi:hypothetical protein